MALTLALVFTLATRQTPTISRDEFGVAHINAPTVHDAFFQAGYAVAQDRLWQMELSRRVARGKLAEVFGQRYAASDKEILSTGYTEDELRQQFEHVSPASKSIIEAYVDGVNAWIDEASKAGLPADFEKAGFKPPHWTAIDSVAICVHTLQLFGRGGAGQIRNLAITSYLKSQKAIGDRYLDVWDDMAWFNDAEAVPTLTPADDPLANNHPTFYRPDRKATEAHLAMIPKLSMLELMGGINISSREESTRVAESLSSPFHTGSYCVVVSPSKSATGHALLLSGPQMGTTIPSIAHEMSIQAPGLSTVGMDVPGIPGIIIGHTNSFAWGLTSGASSTDDIFFFPSDGKTYQAGPQSLPIEKVSQTLKIKDGSDVTVTQSRTIDGPVVMTASGGKTIFSKKAGYWMHEMDTYDVWVDLWAARSPDSIEKAMDRATMNFNFFYATEGGDIGWRYVGRIPKRSSGMDPRFPTPGDPKYAWNGFLSSGEMPHVRNPKSGVLANWNNKPVSWWPNFDTPAWGKIFRNSVLLSTLAHPKLNAQDLEMSAWTIARTDDTWAFFKPFVDMAKVSKGYDLISGFDGRSFDGSRQASNFESFMLLLRRQIFEKTTGGFLNPDFFNMVLQPTYMLRALEHRTKFDYLGKTTPREAVQAALAKLAISPAQPYKAHSFRSLDPTPVPYSNRGTYIQIVEFLRDGIYGRNILPPGVAESGPHSNDQTPLARAWMYKPMRFN